MHRLADMRLGMWENGRFVGHGLAELVGKARHGKLALPKMLCGANALKISDQQPRFRANAATECNNATCPAAREITIRQPQAFPCNVRSLSSTVTQKPTRAFSLKICFMNLPVPMAAKAFTICLYPRFGRGTFSHKKYK
jgi:hypothetical protein